jgi:hypothetical protein
MPFRKFNQLHECKQATATIETNANTSPPFPVAAALPMAIAASVMPVTDPYNESAKGRAALGQTGRPSPSPDPPWVAQDRSLVRRSNADPKLLGLGFTFMATRPQAFAYPPLGWVHSSIEFRLASAMFDFRRPDCFCSHASIMEWAANSASSRAP